MKPSDDLKAKACSHGLDKEAHRLWWGEGEVNIHNPLWAECRDCGLTIQDIIAARDKRIWGLEKLTTIDADKRASDRRNIDIIADQIAVIERMRSLIQRWKDGFEKAPVVELDVANKIYQVSAELIEDLIEQARKALAERRK